MPPTQQKPLVSLLSSDCKIMLENLRSPLKKIIEPLAAALVRAHISANAVTVAGSVLTIVVAICTGMSGYLFAGAAVLTVLVLFDSLDGSSCISRCTRLSIMRGPSSE